MAELLKLHLVLQVTNNVLDFIRGLCRIITVDKEPLWRMAMMRKLSQFTNRKTSKRLSILRVNGAGTLRPLLGMKQYQRIVQSS